MLKGVVGYLYKGDTVVINKHDIENSKEEDFVKVGVFLNEDDIKEWADEIKMLNFDEEEDEEDEG